jgi:hypothetical protein
MIFYSWIYGYIILIKQMAKNCNLEIRLTFVCNGHHQYLVSYNAESVVAANFPNNESHINALEVTTVYSHA